MKLKIIIYPFKLISNILSKTINFILLSIVYFIGISITLVIAKLINKKFLPYKKDSSWEEFRVSNKKEDYYRMF